MMMTCFAPRIALDPMKVSVPMYFDMNLRFSLFWIVPAQLLVFDVHRLAASSLRNDTIFVCITFVWINRVIGVALAIMFTTLPFFQKVKRWATLEIVKELPFRNWKVNRPIRVGLRIPEFSSKVF
ncbi:MAG: hypothetical protein U5J82_03480 [Desulfobacterales bacterium]|nr:hypothetical protein [Desulfobacterales bacterium]